MQKHAFIGVLLRGTIGDGSQLFLWRKGGIIMIKIELKDGSVKEVESGLSILEIAK